MAIFSFWVFDKHCECVYSREWEPKVDTHHHTSRFFNFSLTQGNSTQVDHNNVPIPKNQLSNGLINSPKAKDNAKLLFGALFSLRNIASKLCEDKNVENPYAINNYLQGFSTANYKVHYLETASNWKFALISDPKIEDLTFVLQKIYSEFFNQYVAKNALTNILFDENQFIDNDAFIKAVDSYVSSLPSFTS